MLVEYQNTAGQINSTTCPTKQAFLQLMNSLKPYTTQYFQVAVASSETIGLPAATRCLLMVHRANDSLGIMLAYPETSSTKVYKSALTSGGWSDWIEM